MATTWLTTMKPSFTTEWAGLPHKEAHQVLEKIRLLEQDPRPDAKVKKQLKYLDGKLHRIRCGAYRIFYTFEQPYISLLALRRRSDDTYDEDYDVAFLGGPEEAVSVTGKARNSQPDWEKLFNAQPEAEEKVPEPVTLELLTNLRIPVECHNRLLQITTRQELYSCPGIPDEYLLKLDEYLFEKPLVEVTRQPDYWLAEVDDLLRFKEGELLAFLLKLSPEQAKFVNWGIKASGPTLVKGGPGTGKSTVALYRVKALLERLRAEGQAEPRVLFTTYTNALVISSQQLLKQLLGEDARLVKVVTADSMVYGLLREAGIKPDYASGQEIRHYLKEALALAQTRFEGNLLQKAAQAQALARLSEAYLLDEINSVIVGRQLATLEEYLAAGRSGRKVALSSSQRRAIWQLHLALAEILLKAGKTTFPAARDLAAQLVRQGRVNLTFYDAVVVDEAQDLDPSVLRILVSHCRSAHRLFITADANQSIYGSGFNWSDVHAELRFQGRTGLLRANYRSTREIGEAAQSYLSLGSLDTEAVERVYINNGPFPAVRAVQNTQDEAALLAGFLKRASRDFRLGLGACSVLCPTENAGKALAARLENLKVPATFMASKELDLSRPGVKVLTLKSSKGLEFPIVALAGFFDAAYPLIPASATPEETEEVLSRERRTMFVGMTRAMRALLLVVPAQNDSDLLTGFDGALWNLGIHEENLQYL